MKFYELLLHESEKKKFRIEEKKIEFTTWTKLSLNSRTFVTKRGRILKNFKYSIKLFVKKKQNSKLVTQLKEFFLKKLISLLT